MSTHSAHLERIRPFLTGNTFLGRLPAVVLDTLLGKGQLKQFAKGEYVYRRGSPGDSFLVVIAGSVKLTNTNLGGKEIVLHYVGVGEIFGEIAALDGKERAADAVTMEDTEVFVVATRDLMPTLAAHPQAMMAVIQGLCDKVRAVAALIEDNRLEMRGRTARGLLRLAQQQGRRSADGALQITITQEELGKYLSMVRTNVNRQLAELRLANVIAVTGTVITILDEDGLSEIAQMPASKD